MAIFSYVITRDYGFAPNPFYSVCTLATCKPKIRAAAKVGDWVIGFGSSATKFESKVIYLMKVDKKITFDEYWAGEAYQCKKPVMNGSMKQVYGDNIYHHDKGEWIQENSHHSNPDGSANRQNLVRDTETDKVLISENYWYFGRKAIQIPEELHILVCKGRGHRKFNDVILEERLLKWISTFKETGFIGAPIKFNNGFDRYGGK